MATELKMPALSPTMEEGTLAKWLVKEGDDVKSGDILAEIETDKATMEFEAVDEGKIAKILVPEGTDGVKVGQPIALLAADGETVSDAAGCSGQGRSRDRRRPTQCRSRRSQQAEATPTPHQMETAARELVADVAKPRTSRTCRKALRWSARPFARRCATRWRKRCARTSASSSWARRSPSTRAPTRSRRGCCRSSVRSASSTRRSPNMALPASARARRWAA